MKKTYTFIDLFAGAGGLSEGFMLHQSRVYANCAYRDEQGRL